MSVWRSQTPFDSVRSDRVGGARQDCVPRVPYRLPCSVPCTIVSHHMVVIHSREEQVQEHLEREGDGKIPTFLLPPSETCRTVVFDQAFGLLFFLTIFPFSPPSINSKHHPVAFNLNGAPSLTKLSPIMGAITVCAVGIATIGK